MIKLKPVDLDYNIFAKARISIRLSGFV